MLAAEGVADSDEKLAGTGAVGVEPMAELHRLAVKTRLFLYGLPCWQSEDDEGENAHQDHVADSVKRQIRRSSCGLPFMSMELLRVA